MGISRRCIHIIITELSAVALLAVFSSGWKSRFFLALVNYNASQKDVVSNNKKYEQVIPILEHKCDLIKQ